MMGDSGGDALEGSRRDYIDIIRSPLETITSKTPNDQEILLSVDETSQLATITIKSGAKNCLSGKMISQLTDILDELDKYRGTCKGLLIRGYGGTFCSGSDLIAVRETASHELGLSLAQIMQFNLMRLQRMPMVSVAFIDGYALGGGAELAMGADLRVMSKGARIGFVHAKVGICCGWGGGSRLVQLVGPARAMDLLASGRTVGAPEALEMGLANRLVDTADGALEYLVGRTVSSARTIGALKSMINSARLLPLERALEVEGQLYASTWGKPEHLDALDQNMKHKQ